MSIVIKFRTEDSSAYKMRQYDKPTLGQLKNEIISDVFKGVIINPSFEAIDESCGGETITIETDKDLELAMKYLPEGKRLLKMIVKEKPTADTKAPVLIQTTATQTLKLGRPLSISARPYTPSTNSAVPPQTNSSNSPETRLTVNLSRPLSNNVRTPRAPKLNARFTAHVTCGDRSSLMYPGMKFFKIWKFKNDGDKTWPKEIQLIFVSVKTGDQMGGPESLNISFPEEIQIGQEVDIKVPLIAPEKPGKYEGHWKLADLSGKKFGQRVRVQITVAEFPGEAAVINDDQTLEEKKTHLMRLFPDQALKINDLVDDFLKGIEFKGPTEAKPTLDMVLDGGFKKSDGERYTMGEIIHFMHKGNTSHENHTPYPWTEASNAAPSTRIATTMDPTGTIALPRLHARLVENVTCFDDSSIMYPGMKFFKIWRFRNDGGLKWPTKIHLSFISKTGDQMGGPDFQEIFFKEPVPVGEEIEIKVPLTAPEKPGKYQGFWRLADEAKKKFGSRVIVEITVAEFPGEKALMNDEQTLDMKKTHLKRLFPTHAHDIDKLAEFFHEGIEFEESTGAIPPTLDMVLDGGFKKSNGERYTMGEIIHFVHKGNTLHGNRTLYPWTEPTTKAAPSSQINPTIKDPRIIAMPKLKAQYVKDVTCFGDSSIMYPGMKFFKTWKIRNNGTLKWPTKIHLIHAFKESEERMGGPAELPILFDKQIELGEEVEIKVPLIAPAKPGKYTVYWKLADENKKKFSHDLQVDITVAEFPGERALMNDEQTLEEKKTHIKRLFPTQAHENYKLVELFNEGIEFEESTGAIRPTLDMVLDGHFTKSDGKRYTMGEIIHFMHKGKLLHGNSTPYPWTEKL